MSIFRLFLSVVSPDEVGGWGNNFVLPIVSLSSLEQIGTYIINAPHPFISYGNYFYWLINVNKDNIVCLLVVGLHLT